MTKRILLERQIQGMLNWKTLDEIMDMIIDTDIKAHVTKCFSVLIILGVTEISPKYKNPEKLLLLKPFITKAGITC